MVLGTIRISQTHSEIQGAAHTAVAQPTGTAIRVFLALGFRFGKRGTDSRSAFQLLGAFHPWCALAIVQAFGLGKCTRIILRYAFSAKGTDSAGIAVEVVDAVDLLGSGADPIVAFHTWATFGVLLAHQSSWNTSLEFAGVVLHTLASFWAVDLLETALNSAFTQGEGCDGFSLGIASKNDEENDRDSGSTHRLKKCIGWSVFHRNLLDDPAKGNSKRCARLSLFHRKVDFRRRIPGSSTTGRREGERVEPGANVWHSRGIQSEPVCVC